MSRSSRMSRKKQESAPSNPVFGWLLPVCGSFLLVSSLAHGFLGWPSVRPALEQAKVAPEAMLALAIGWYFGSAAMATLGVVVLFAWREVRAQSPRGRAVVATIAAAYVLFGIAAFVASSFEGHFVIAFIVPGVVLAVAAWKAPWARRSVLAADGK